MKFGQIKLRTYQIYCLYKIKDIQLASRQNLSAFIKCILYVVQDALVSGIKVLFIFIECLNNYQLWLNPLINVCTDDCQMTMHKVMPCKILTQMLIVLLVAINFLHEFMLMRLLFQLSYKTQFLSFTGVFYDESLSFIFVSIILYYFVTLVLQVY